MEINAEKTKIIRSDGTLQRYITIQGLKLETVDHFKYLGSRAAQTMAALASLKIWNIRIKHKIRLMHALVITIFLM